VQGLMRAISQAMLVIGIFGFFPTIGFGQFSTPATPPQTFHSA
jgi:hypothetical protein